MNNVNLIGRLVKDPDVKYTTNNMAIARFTLAVDRPMKKDEADFISVVCFGKTAELVEKYVQKGRQVALTGRIQTGSYEKDGQKVYTTDVVADRVEFLSAPTGKAAETPTHSSEPIPEGFNKLTEEDLPF